MPKGKRDTSSWNKWYVNAGRRGWCMLLDPSCGFAVVAELKHWFREWKAWVHFPFKGFSSCIFRDTGISEKSQFLVHKRFPWHLVKPLPPKPCMYLFVGGGQLTGSCHILGGNWLLEDSAWTLCSKQHQTKLLGALSSHIFLAWDNSQSVWATCSSLCYPYEEKGLFPV